MKRTALLALVLAAGCATATRTPVLVPFADGDYWMLQQPLRYDLGSTGQSIVVPAGFVTDFASVPDALCAILPAAGSWLPAALVHDFLYWDQSCTREQADRIFLHAMTAARVPEMKKTALYGAARLAGARAWATNTRERQEGMVQIVPRRALPEATWHVVRQQLRGTREPDYERPSPRACAAADTLP